MASYSITLPYPPSINHYYCRTRFGGMAIAKKGKEYRKEVAMLIKQKFRNKVLTGNVTVAIHLFPPDRRKRDIDNVLKCLLDSIEDSGIIENDNQINVLLVTKKEIYTGEVFFSISKTNAVGVCDEK